MTSVSDALDLEATNPVTGNKISGVGDGIDLVKGTIMVLGAVGIGNFFYNQIKSATGSESVKNAVPEV